MSPQRLDNHILHVLQLVGLASRLGGVGHLGGRGVGYRGRRLGSGGLARHVGRETGWAGGTVLRGEGWSNVCRFWVSYQ